MQYPPHHHGKIDRLWSEIEPLDRHMRNHHRRQHLHRLFCRWSRLSSERSSERPFPQALDAAPDVLKRLLLREDAGFVALLDADGEGSPEVVVVSADELHELVVRSDAEGFERDGDRDVFLDRVVLEEDFRMLREDVGLRFALVRRTARFRQPMCRLCTCNSLRTLSRWP